VTETNYDISPYCRTYISHRNYTEVTSDTASPVTEYCYCTVKEYKNDVLQLTTEFICFDGYGYHIEGENPQHGDEFLTDGTYYCKYDDNGGGVYYYDDQTVTWEAKYTGLSTGGTTTVTLGNTVGYVPYIHDNYKTEGNTLEIVKNSVVRNTYTFEVIEECKYTPIECDFVNKHGAWQRVIFFKAKQESFDMNNTEYNLMPSSTTYNIKDNIRSVFNVNGRDKITCNTGWVPESYSDVMTQLMLSEKILLDDVPVILETKSIERQTNINNKNINYKVGFKYSAEKLNYNI
jgi:hypothetical protein